MEINKKNGLMLLHILFLMNNFLLFFSIVVTLLLLPKVYGYFIDKYKNAYRIR